MKKDKTPPPSPISPEAIAELRVLRDRANEKASVLGQLDVQVAIAEQRRAQARGEAAKELGELDAKLSAAAKAQGIFGQPGWQFDFAAGRFVRTP